MTKFAKIAGLVFAGVIVGLLLSAASSNRLGGVYNQVTNYFREGIKVGTGSQFEVTSAGAITSSGAVGLTSTLTLGSGTAHDKILSGTVTCLSETITVIMGGTATTTCSVPGVAAGDTVIVTPPAGHPGALRYSGVATTSDRIGVILYNATTTSTTIGATATSGIGYLIFSR